MTLCPLQLLRVLFDRDYTRRATRAAAAHDAAEALNDFEAEHDGLEARTDAPAAVIPPAAAGIPDPSPTETTTLPRGVGGEGAAAVSGPPVPPAAAQSSFRFARFFGDR